MRPRSTTRAAWMQVLALAIVAGAATAAPPRQVGRAFLDAGVPLNGVALVVQDVAKTRPLFTHQPDRPYNPASVMKLVTTFAALELLGPDYRWKTFAYLDGPLDAGVLRGNLVLQGRGDPKITIERWQAFMSTLREKGLAAVEGDLVLDRTYFAPVTHDASAFDGEPQKPYNVAGMGRPSTPRCVGAKLVAKPAAPASIDSRRTACICAISSSVATRSYAASPITNRRSAV